MLCGSPEPITYPKEHEQIQCKSVQVVKIPKVESKGHKTNNSTMGTRKIVRGNSPNGPKIVFQIPTVRS